MPKTSWRRRKRAEGFDDDDDGIDAGIDAVGPLDGLTREVRGARIRA